MNIVDPNCAQRLLLIYRSLKGVTGREQRKKNEINAHIEDIVISNITIYRNSI